MQCICVVLGVCICVCPRGHHSQKCVLSPSALLPKLAVPDCVQDESPEDSPKPSLPAAIVNVSAQAGTGLAELQAALQPLLPTPGTIEPAADNHPDRLI